MTSIWPIPFEVIDYVLTHALLYFAGTGHGKPRLLAKSLAASLARMGSVNPNTIAASLHVPPYNLVR